MDRSNSRACLNDGGCRMAAITLDELRKEFDETVAVDGVTLSVADGEFLVLVGPSGCGKSTLLRTVAGLETQTDGDLRIDDRLVNDVEPKNRGVAMVFQDYALYPHMSARRNMTFGLGSHGSFSDEEVDRMVEDVAETLGIGDLLSRKPGELSGGEKQRVAMGRALLREPAVFLLDEPLSNLDAKLRTEMRTEINRLQNELDVTTLYVTHDQTEAMTMGDRLVVLNYGELQQIGTPLDCFYRPANRFVAGFLGSPSMNFFEGHIEGGTLRADGFDYDLTERMQSSVGSRNEVTLGIRPEDAAVHNQPSSDHEFEAMVDVVEPMGSISYIYLRAVEQDAEQTFIVETDGQRSITEGERVYVEVPDRDVHLFDGADGETIHQRELERDAELALQKEA